MFADSFAHGELADRQAFVTQDIKDETEDSVIPPSEMAHVLRYIKAACFGMVLTGTLLFLLGLLAPLNYLDGVHNLLAAEPVITMVLAGLLLAYGLIQVLRARAKRKPHYLLSGLVFTLLTFGLVLFTLTGVNWTAKYYIVGVGVAMWTLQCSQEWDFSLTMEMFLKQVQSEVGLYRLKAREGDEVLTQPAMGSILSMFELKWLFGCTRHKTREQLDADEAINQDWGNFMLKDEPDKGAATTDQLIAAYNYAADTDFSNFPSQGQKDPRFTQGYEALRDIFSRSIAFLEGLTIQLSWFTSLAFAGLEVGGIVFGESNVNGTPRIIAVILAGLTLLAFGFNVYQFQSLLTTALGLPVAEREWMAIDLMDKLSDKQRFRARFTDESQQRRLNLTYFWLCASACADSSGAGIISKFCHNCALMTKCMLEEGTSLEFIGFAATRFQLQILGNVINILQIFFLAMMSVMWFGSYGINTNSEMFWAGFVLFICFFTSGLRIRQSAKLWHAIEAQANWQNYAFAGMLVTYSCIMLVLVTCLVPIILGNGNLLGSCSNSKLYADMFPDLCSHLASQNLVAHWIIIGSIGAAIGLTIGTFLFGSPRVVVVES
mmetsp:Transcript_87259/g.154596  ORF Transcript_87259/g.154596 Transcript_87259/m.154596 type:complete len:603 (+) Transcript_87259:61-1869(+)